MRYAWLVIAILGARFFSTALTYPSGDGDLAWQRWLGAIILRTHALPSALGAETFTAAGAPWVPQEWLFSIAADLGRTGLGWTLFAGSAGAAAVVALSLAAAHAARRGASQRAILLCLALAGIAFFESYGVRAQVLAWPMVAGFLWLLDLDGPWAYAALAVAAAWANLHASAMLAPVLAGLAASGSFLDERGPGPRTRRLALIAAGSLLAICCTPLGWELPKYAIGLFNNPIKSYINEWKVTDIDDSSFAFGVLPLLMVAMLCSVRAAGRRWRDVVVLGALAFLVLSAARNVAVFAIVALPIVAPALSRRVAFFTAAPKRAPTPLDRFMSAALPIGAFAMAAVVAALLVRSAPPATGLANAPLEALVATPGEHRLYCADFAWCSLVLATPNVRVFLDGRADPYPASVWRDSVAILRVQPDWLAVLARRGVDAIVVSRGTPLDQALALAPPWHVAYVDATYRLWLRGRQTALVAGGRRGS
jgi:hypothetical protein